MGSELTLEVSEAGLGVWLYNVMRGRPRSTLGLAMDGRHFQGEGGMLGGIAATRLQDGLV